MPGIPGNPGAPERPKGPYNSQQNGGRSTKQDQKHYF